MGIRKQKIIKCDYCGKDAIVSQETRYGKIGGKKFAVHLNGWPLSQGESCLEKMRNKARKERLKITF